MRAVLILLVIVIAAGLILANPFEDEATSACKEGRSLFNEQMGGQYGDIALFNSGLQGREIKVGYYRCRAGTGDGNSCSYELRWAGGRTKKTSGYILSNPRCVQASFE